MFAVGKLPGVIFKMVLAQDVIAEVVFTPGVIIINFLCLVGSLYYGDQLFIQLRGFDVLFFIIVFPCFGQLQVIIGAF